MIFQGNGKYTVNLKDKTISDVTIEDIRSFFDSLDDNIAKDISYRYKRRFSIGEYSLYDIEDFLSNKVKFEGNLGTDFVQEIYKYMNIQNKISKKKAAKIIAKKFDKSIKTIEKHLYKKN